MEAQVVFNTNTELFDLIIVIDGLEKTISTSKNYGHFQYHLNRGTLSKTISRYGITSFIYVGFTPSKLPISDESQPKHQRSNSLTVETSWFGSKFIGSLEHKKRGRPRKYLPNISGVIVHKLSDVESTFKIITPEDKEMILRNFKMFLRSMNTREALEEIILKFQIPYKQAYEITVNYI